MAAAGGPITATEVPIVGGDRIRWIELTVPSSTRPSPEPIAPISPRDVASCHVVPGDPPAYLIWRIHKNLPNVVEVVELFACKEFPETGLHLVFQDALCPFAFICKNEIHTTTGKEYILYVLTVSGVAYCLKLRSPFAYVSGCNFPRNELSEFDMENPTVGKITAVAATSGCLVTGRQDGSIGCFRLGLDLHAPDFSTELRDDVGLGRLWNIMSRAKIVGAVQDMVISQMYGRKLLFSLHLDGYLRGWDLASHTRFLSHNITLRDVAGIIKPSRLWVAVSSYPTKSICLAVLYRGAAVSDKIAVYNFDCSVGEKIILSSEPSMQIINLEEIRNQHFLSLEGGCIHRLLWCAVFAVPCDLNRGIIASGATVKVAAMWSGGHGSEPRNSLSACRDKAAYVDPP